MNKKVAAALTLLSLSFVACEPTGPNSAGLGRHAETVRYVPEFFLLEGEADGAWSEVAHYRDGGKRRETWGRVPHAVGSARHGIIVQSLATAFVVVRGAEAPREEDFGSELWAISSGHTRRLLSGIMDGSSVLWSPRHGLVVQRGAMGTESQVAQRGVLIERSDVLTVDRVEPASGHVQTLWEGRGQLAWLPLLVSEGTVLVEHIHEGQIELFLLALASGAVEVLGQENRGVVRDFTVADHGRELRFVRPSRARSSAWAWTARSLQTGEERVLMEGEGPPVAPLALGDAAWLTWEAKDRTLVVHNRGDARGYEHEGGVPRPLGLRVLGHSETSRWLAVEARFSTGAEFQILNGSMNPLLRLEAHSTVREFLGFSTEAP